MFMFETRMTRFGNFNIKGSYTIDQKLLSTQLQLFNIKVGLFYVLKTVLKFILKWKLQLYLNTGKNLK